MRKQYKNKEEHMNKPAISLVSLLALCSCAAQEPIVSLTCGPEESMAW